MTFRRLDPQRRAAAIAASMALLIGAALFVALLLAGCASAPTIVSRPVALPLPPRPTLPHARGSELQCLTGSAYARLLTREQLLARWAQQMAAIIRANNDAATTDHSPLTTDPDGRH